MLDNRGGHAVVKLLTDLGHHLDLRGTAEGVENARQLSALRALGVQDAQGYHLGRPMPADDLAALLTPPAYPRPVRPGDHVGPECPWPLRAGTATGG